MARSQSTCQLIAFLASLFLVAPASAQKQAQRADRSGDERIREATEQALRMAHPNLANGQLKIRRRRDLEEDLTNIAEKPVRDVFFYEMESPPLTAFDDDSISVVAVARYAEGVYQVYSFQTSEGLNSLSQQFNHLIDPLTLSIPKEKATSLAGFFLTCCVGGSLTDIELDEEGLHHAVERYYLQSYGDVWWALDTQVQWWEGFQKNASDLAPTIRFEDGRYRVVLKHLFLAAGKHPQLQEWELEISRNGEVRILAMQPIFPKQARWLFYDSRSSGAAPLP